MSKSLQPCSGQRNGRIINNLPSIKFNKVVNPFGKYFTKVSLANYIITSGITARDCSEIIPLGYCTESPLEVLKDVFPDYFVTDIGDYNLFSSEPFEGSPMKGLYLEPIPPVFGIEGKLENLLELALVQKAKRKKLVTKDEANSIMERLSEVKAPFYSREAKQIIHDKKQLLGVFNKFA